MMSVMVARLDWTKAKTDRPRRQDRESFFAGQDLQYRANQAMKEWKRALAQPKPGGARGSATGADRNFTAGAPARVRRRRKTRKQAGSNEAGANQKLATDILSSIARARKRELNPHGEGKSWAPPRRAIHRLGGQVIRRGSITVWQPDPEGT